MPRLGVNIDHVATIREARKTVEPDPVWAAAIAELAGADGITVHLREDRRHIRERDVEILRKTVRSRLNLEMACVDEIVEIALGIRPDQATLVPERREEVTTEGGLDVGGGRKRVAEVTERLRSAGIQVSHFIGPDLEQVRASADCGAAAVEIHTGQYAEAPWGERRDSELARVEGAIAEARRLGLHGHAGHGLTYLNVVPVARIEGMEELNIGHSIISRAVLVGLDRAVREMKQLMLTSGGEE
jgi:pyridoxine 5-phosphate synthase